MSVVDSRAAKALARMLRDNNSISQLETIAAYGWCQFLYSLIVRNPEHLQLIKQKLGALGPEVLEELREHYDQIRKAGDPETFDQYKDNFSKAPIVVPPARVLPTLINSELVVKRIASTKWATHDVRTAKHPLLTSDRPVIMTNGLNQSAAHIVLPISPHKLFIAAKDDDTLRKITSPSSDELVETANSIVAEQAYTFVYGSTDTQLRFVANRLGKRIPSSPLG